jgi:environmental stress-induced protein Ves
MTLRHFRWSDYQQMPWKNGKGTTLQLAIYPENAVFAEGDFDWRVSMAPVSADGAFSLFPGYERLLLINEGEGLVLVDVESGARTVLPRGKVHGFSGERRVRSELVQGPVRDFGVVYRRGLQVSLEVVRLRSDPKEYEMRSEVGFWFCAVGRAKVGVGAEFVELETEESVLIQGLPGRRVLLEGDEGTEVFGVQVTGC